MASRFFYFSTPDDLFKIVSSIDASNLFHYVKCGNYTKEAFKEVLMIDTLLDYPKLGYSISGQCRDVNFLVLPKDQQIQVKRTNGYDELRLIISQELNNPSVTWSVGGLWNDNMIIKGEISTLYTDSASKKIVQYLKRYFGKFCVKENGYFISPGVKEMINCRLITIGADKPEAYDFRS